jgi:hypothetical protein
MAFLVFGLMAVLWIGVGILLVVRNRQRKAARRFDPESGVGVLVGSLTPLAILFYLLSCVAAPGLAYTVQVASEEGLSPLVALILLVMAVLTIGLPLWALLMKWRERTVVDAEGIQFPQFPFRLVRLPWAAITELKAVTHMGAHMRRFITEVSIHTPDRVYKPTWDAATWKLRGRDILHAIASRAHLVELGSGHWVRE